MIILLAQSYLIHDLVRVLLAMSVSALTGLIYCLTVRYEDMLSFSVPLFYTPLLDHIALINGTVKI